MSNTEETAKDTRSASQIAADLENVREQMASTVDELVGKLDPAAQLEKAKAYVSKKAETFPQDARQWVEDTSVKARETLEAAREGDEEAIKKVGIFAAASAAIVGLLTFRIFRRR